MIKLRNFFHALILVSLCLSIVSCEAEEEENIPDNEIVDEDGLRILLEWTTGGSSAISLEDTDLELYINKGETSVSSSESGSSFEEVVLSGLLADATYEVAIDVYRIDKDTDFTLFITGIESERTVQYTGSFNGTDDDASFPSFVTIAKVGNRYTISR